MSTTAPADLLFRPVTELAGMVRDGELTARELVQASLDRIAALDPEVNAFVDVLAEQALAEADAVGPGDPRPFAGVPIAVKNNRAVAGARLTFGARLTGDFTPSHDDEVVARLRRAGFVVVGTTTLPEYGILPVTETARFGATQNPWAPGRTPGGSSGGSAAAVAAGMVPIAHANDGGGSTRIPAACCGLVGLKPQRGRISLAPAVGEAFLVQDGVLTRTVAETAQVLDLLAGPALGDASWAAPPAEPFATTAAAEPRGLRIALSLQPLLEADLDPVIAAAVRATGTVLAGLGHEVVETDDAPWAGMPGLLELFAASFGPAVSTQIAFAGILAGREPVEADMEPLSWGVWRAAQQLTAVQGALAAFQLQALGRQAVTWAARYDAVLTPTLAEAPVAHGTIDPLGPDPTATFTRGGAFAPYAALSNVTGSPAISLPLQVRPDGVPIGIQLIGQPAREGALLALAAQLERALPWHGRRPVVG